MSDQEGEIMEIDDLLSEILLRLPPEPCSLPRASLVSTRWRRLSRDPALLRRFRARHRRHAPLLGAFFTDYSASTNRHSHISFAPTLDPPNRVRFSFPVFEYPCMVLGCRHGLLLASFYYQPGLLVWDPVTGDQHRLDHLHPPGGFKFKTMNGAVLRSTQEDIHFKVVMVGHDEQHTQVIASVYSSQTREWGSVISAPIPPTVSVVTAVPSVLIGDSLYWSSSRNPAHPTTVLEFNLGTKSLAVIDVPVNMYAHGNRSFSVMRAEDGGLGFLFLSGHNAQLWKRNTDGDGVASWAITKTIQLDKLLSLNTNTEEEEEDEEERSLSIEGLAENTNVLFLRTSIGRFMVHLDSLWSLRCKELSQAGVTHVLHPFTSVYTAADNNTLSPYRSSTRQLAKYVRGRYSAM
ncbi:hypothetical protein VPH35_119121 [Triticum aestivum]|uniref:uncharacterized protein n=1 Tax=Triticum aestivum TaxID=4565 RepID=UPI001D030A88|nr:uncharacterized protein LOC123142123 [Triticum aestivum]